MNTIAKEAGVTRGTAYSHYQSKEQLLVAAYLELKRELGTAACADIDRTATPHDRFIQVWLGVYHFLAQETERAQFMLQIDSSPLSAGTHARDGNGRAGRPDDGREPTRSKLPECSRRSITTACTTSGSCPPSAGAQQATASTRPPPAPIAEACWRAITTG